MLLSDQDLLILVGFFLVVIAIGYSVYGSLQLQEDKLLVKKVEPAEDEPPPADAPWYVLRWYQIRMWFKAYLKVLRPKPKPPDKPKKPADVEFSFKGSYDLNKVPSLTVKVKNNTDILDDVDAQVVKIHWAQSRIIGIGITGPTEKPQPMVYVAEALKEKPTIQKPTEIDPGIQFEGQASVPEAIELRDGKLQLKDGGTLVKIVQPTFRSKIELQARYRDFMRGLQSRDLIIRLVTQVGNGPLETKEQVFKVKRQTSAWHIVLLKAFLSKKS
ncbi:hypothetical protein [Leptolyngbya sp. FACHB-261]|uniref:hypothetical protein n=1 Tax=Leptolyngbya sp. FACHB-261 TaxID=2692806 RepID=UPI0016841B18|nr:hypothetical protein [Leptolyngbya sp. FACHB-261]MBD2104786.1 hypothetical protein [Leptolyngbya sp. FACHB-261]